MESIKLWARNGEAVRQAIALGELVHMETASEELTDEFLLFAIERCSPVSTLKIAKGQSAG